MNNKRIAAHLRTVARDLMHESEHERIAITIPGTRLTIRCAWTRDAILAIACKYEKGKTPRAPIPQRLGRCSRPGKPSRYTFLRFWDDGEHDNAREYLRLYDREHWPRELVEIVAEAECR